MDKLLPYIHQHASITASASSLLVTACEVLRGIPECADQIQAAFKHAWELTPDPMVRFRLLCYSIALPSPAFDRLLECFDSSFVQMVTSPSAFEFIIGCVTFTGVVAIVWPDSGDAIVQNRVLPVVLNAILTGGLPDTFAEFRRLLAAALQMMINVLEWSEAAYRDPATIAVVFQVRSFLEQPRAGLGKLLGDPALGSLVRQLSHRLLISASQHSPCPDHYSRRLDSAAEISESAVMKAFGISGYVTSYCSVGDSLLLSFLEKADDAAPLVIFARGPFGKSIWAVSGDLPAGEVSDELKPEELPTPRETPLQPLELRRPHSGHLLDDAILNDDSGKLREHRFSKWLDWSKFGYYYPLDHHWPSQRSRAVDFLTTLGLVDSQNSGDVRVHSADSLTLKSVLDRLDALDSPHVAPILLTHVLPDDSSLTITEESAVRMTPLMRAFMEDIGEPMLITDAAADAHALPRLRTAVPVFPCFGGFAAVLSPAMLKSDNVVADFAKIKGSIRLIFNETNFEMTGSETHGEEAVLIVKPSIEGLYFVWQAQEIAGISSPFSTKQTLSASVLAFYLSMLVEQTVLADVAVDIPAKRKEVIEELCSGPVVRELGPIASGAFPFETA
jgi:hypothetical protein